MNINTEGTNCCLSKASVMETSKHLFVDCEYAARMNNDIQQWNKINLNARDVNTALEMIKAKH